MTFLADDTDIALPSPVRLVAPRDCVHPAVVPTLEGGPSGPAGLVKRTGDLLGAAVLLVVFLPVIAIAAVGVRCTSGGPVLFRQVRVGRDGRGFTMWKLRTFPVDHVDDQFSRPVSACPTAWGRFLRRTSIDELPQLVNVLSGDMSLVGPRPERPRFAVPLVTEIAGYRERHRSRPGLTGLAQVRGLWGNSSLDDRIAADNEYLDGWSLWLDLRILVRTVGAVVNKFRH